MSHSPFIGRIGQLRELVSRPELNGAYISVDSFNSEKDRFTVRTLPAPNSDADSVSVSVKATNFTLCDPGLFQHNFSEPTVQQGSFSRNTYSPGTILDFTDVPRPSSLPGRPTQGEPARELVFNESCRVIGAASAPELGCQPLTQFPDKTLISANNSSACIEFWNINFTSGYVCPAGGASIVFRNCRFGGEAGLIVGDKTRSTNVLVESCVFEDITGMAAYVLQASNAVFLDCTFLKCRLGVNVDEGASAVVTHCRFIECSDGIETLARADTLEVLNCMFDKGSNGYNQRSGCDASLKGCRFQELTAAVSAEGPKRTVLHIEDCVVTDCKLGVSANMGKVELTMTNTKVTKCTWYGAFFAGNLLGSVSLTKCNIRGNRPIDVFNFCGPQCPVTIDGVVEKTDSASMNARLAYLKPIWMHMQNTVIGEEQSSPNAGPPSKDSIKSRRTSKLSGLGYVECSNCKLREGMEEKFKACSKCENEVYCSKECQVAHWKEHKKECGKVVYC